MAVNQTYDDVYNYLQELESVAVAYSGGVDSTFLLAVAVEALGKRALAVIGRSPVFPSIEENEAVKTAERLGAAYLFVDTAELSDEVFCSNPTNRCYLCKSKLLKKIQDIADDRELNFVIEGSNADDLSDFRPGMEAVRELGVRSPLLDLEITKDQIRETSRMMGLPTWNRPSFACLASRIPYGNKITLDKLVRIEKTEAFLRKNGFEQCRVRDYGDLCRIEVSPDSVFKLGVRPLRQELLVVFKGAGYKYICVDLEGFRSGSMNDVLDDDDMNNELLPR